MFRQITYKASLAFLCLSGLMLTGCNDDNDIEVANGTSLQLSPQLFGMFDKSTGTTRAGDEDLTELIGNLRENYMGKRLEVYVVGTGTNNSDFFNKYVFDETSQISSQYYLMERNWRRVNTTGNQQYVIGDQYRLYALVNRNSNNTTATEINSLADLKAALVGYYDDTHGIHRWYDINATSAPWPDSNNGHDGWELDKTFAMDGYKDFTFTSNDSDVKVDVDLKRAACKIVLDMKIDPDFLKTLAEEEKDNGGNPILDNQGNPVMVINAGNPRARPVNFNYHAYAVDGFTDRSDLEFETHVVNGYNFDDDNKNESDPEEVENPYREYRFVTYSYPFSWADDELEKTPYLVVSIGLAGGFYYYTIPITQKSVKEMKRNYVYHIDATITGFGALKVDDELEQVINLHYDVIPWTVLDSEINIVDVEGDIDFLMVEPIEQNMYGANADPAEITVYASDPSLVRWVKQEVYYYNANNTKVTNGNNNNSTTNKTYWSDATMSRKEGSNNRLIVTSDVLKNHAVKVIKYRIYFDANNNGQLDSGEKYQDIIVRHFPLDFFQNDQGLWSSRTTSGWWNYNTNGTGNNANGTKSGDIFRAKYYDKNNGYIRIWQGNNYGWYQSQLKNRNKYVIQITETSNDYTIGKPTLVDNLSNDHVVSPAFMIASQLGATTNQDNVTNTEGVTIAKNNCTLYKEVDEDGTEWTNWRLPTREEVGVIIKYQHAGYDTMDPVLTGEYYWTLEGKAVATGASQNSNTGVITWASDWATRYSNPENDYYSYTYWGTVYGSGSTYTRCIRDLSPDEVNTINGRIGHE